MFMGFIPVSRMTLIWKLGMRYNKKKSQKCLNDRFNQYSWIYINCLEFNSYIKLQISGIAIGTKFTASFLSQRLLKDMDEVHRWFPFFLFSSEIKKNELEGFLQCFNDFHTNLKITTVSINGDEFETELHCKPTNCNQILEFNLAHPFGKKKIIWSHGYSLNGCVPN